MTKIRQPAPTRLLGHTAPKPNIPPKVKTTRTRAAGPGGALTTVPTGRGDAYKPDATDLALKKQLDSQFSKHRLALQEAQNDPGEKSMMIVYQALLDMVLNLIPLAEEKYREQKAERAAYALNVYINQVREIQNDMRGLHDFSQTGFRIIEIIAHTFTMILQNLVSERGIMSQELALKLSHSERNAVEAALQQMTQNQGRYMNEALKGLRDQIMAQFVTAQPMVGGGARRQTVVRSR